VGSWAGGLGYAPHPPIPNPQSPIPNPQIYLYNLIILKIKNKLFNN